MYRQKLHYFEYVTGFDDMKVIEEFESWIDKNVKELFSSHEMQNVKISVNWAQARSLVNNASSYRKTLSAIANTINMSPTPKVDGSPSKYKNMHQQQIFANIIGESSNFQTLINKLNKYLQNLSKHGYTWNKVIYAEYMDGISNM